MSMETAFHALKATWRKMLDNSIKDKKAFQDEANECMAFFDGPYDFLYGKGGKGDLTYKGGIKNIPKPSIAVTVNKVAEGVQLFGPSLYHKNPMCKVTPREAPAIPFDAFGDMQNPQVQQQMQGIIQQLQQREKIDSIRSALLSGYLNYLPTAINLKKSSRRAIDQGIITGAGVLWMVMDQPAGGNKLPTVEYDTIKNLFIDPDVQMLEDARYVMRRFCKPVWEVESERGIPHGELKGNASSSSMDAAEDPLKKKEGKTNDLLVYYGIWSKMGLGALLKGITKDAAELDRYGQFVYIEICDSYECFLNVPRDIWDNDEEVRRRLQWETPFWCDVPTSNGWPFEMFAFHEVPDKIWPMSHFKAGLGHLQFINWATSFLISGIQKRSRDFIAIAKSSGEELKRAIKSGEDMEVIEIQQSLEGSINKVVEFLQHPEFHKDIMPIIQWQQSEFEKATGLNELMYGLQQRQDRSATESKIKENFINVRPDDMANTVEDPMSGVFRKLALMARWHMSGADIANVYGPVVGDLWQQYVATADIGETMHALEYRIEAGSTRKPNKQKDIDDADMLMQNLFQTFSQFVQSTGNVSQFNALMTVWGEAHDRDVSAMLLPEPPPQPPAPPPGAEMEQELQQNEAEHQQDMKNTAEKHSLNMRITKDKAKASASKAKAKPKG